MDDQVVDNEIVTLTLLFREAWLLANRARSYAASGCVEPGELGYVRRPAAPIRLWLLGLQIHHTVDDVHCFGLRRGVLYQLSDHLLILLLHVERLPEQLVSLLDVVASLLVLNLHLLVRSSQTLQLFDLH